MLSELNIKAIKQSKNAGYKYKITKEQLLEIYINKKWFDEKYDFINKDDDDDETVIDKLYPKLKTCDENNKDNIIKEKNDEIEMLKQKIYEMEQMLLNNKKQSMKDGKQKMKPKSIEDEYSFSDEDIKIEADIIKETIKQQKEINKKLREKEKKKKEKKEVIDLDKVFEDDILKDIFD